MKTIIDYGAGNVFSVMNALKRLGYSSEVTADLEMIKSADKVIFPGVGQASAAMKKLKETGLDKLLPQLKMPVLGICLGMQLMCRSTQEDNTDGLNIIPIDILKFKGDFKIPHMGWNNIFEFKSDLFKGISQKERMYFVHSFYAPISEYCIAKTDYYGEFAAAINKDNFYGCQFHPEKSSSLGEQILLNFLEL